MYVFYLHVCIHYFLQQANIPPAPDVIAAAIVADVHNQNALMEAALMRLGFSLLAAREFTGNGISNLNRLRTLTEEALDRLIKQIHWDNQGAGLFIPFASQQHVHAIRFWANRMHIIGSPFSIEDINEPLAEMWGESMKIEERLLQPRQTL